jgi:hypothetical protein
MGLSLSSLGQAAVCPGSAVLPGTEGVAGAPGNGLHEYVSILLRDGRREANAALDGIVDRWALGETDASIVRWRAGYFEPDVPDGALSEQPLCLMEDGSVVEVEGARGVYDMPAGGLLAGTIDLGWSEAEPLDRTATGWRAPRGSQLWAVDLKSGSEAHTPALERNWQVRGSALLLARWVGLPRRGVVGALCFLPRSKQDPRGGVWKKPDVAWGAADLARFEAEIRGVVARVEASRKRLEAGELPEFVTGPQCTFCKARVTCPAYAVEARAIVQASTAGGRFRLPTLAEVDDAWLARAATALPDIERAGRGLRSLLEAAVAQRGPIPLADGRVWGPEDCGATEKFGTRALYQALVGEIENILPMDETAEDPERDRFDRAVLLADEAFKTSGAAMEAAVQKAMDIAGETRTRSSHMGALKARARERGGARPARAIKWRPHHAERTAALSIAAELPAHGEEAAE